MWEHGRDGLGDRLAAHLEKALREAREVTNWTHPREEAEQNGEDFARTLAREWQNRLPDGAEELFARARDLSLAQVALKVAMPGIPDFYQGAEGPLHHLTDPDNRLAVDWDRLRGPDPRIWAAEKDALTRRLLALRATYPNLFLQGAIRVEGNEDAWTFLREGPEGRLTLQIAWTAPPGQAVSLHWAPHDEACAAE
jgi:(1->4)-alpha-D-glucan 1-alpha-D-glucosylmutase